MRRFHSPTLSVIAAFAVGTTMLHGADEAPSIEQRLQALDQEVKILKRKAELTAEETTAKAATAKDAPKFTANPKDGFSLSSADGAYKLRIGGFAQIEGRYFLDDAKLLEALRALEPREKNLAHASGGKRHQQRVAPELARLEGPKTRLSGGLVQRGH